MVHSRLSKNNNLLETSFNERPLSMYDNLSPATENTSNATTLETATVKTTPTTMIDVCPKDFKNDSNEIRVYTNIPYSYKNVAYNNKQQQVNTCNGIKTDKDRIITIGSHQNHGLLQISNGHYISQETTTANEAKRFDETISRQPLPCLEMTIANDGNNDINKQKNKNDGELFSSEISAMAISRSHQLQPGFSISQSGRPLSGGDLNETTSASVAAVKAALNEAKSKFFGLNNDNQYNQHHNDNNDNDKYQNKPLISNNNHNEVEKLLFNKDNDQPQKQPPQCVQPRYQNIPENSAIYRNYLTECATGSQSGTDTSTPNKIQKNNTENNMNGNKSTELILTNHSGISGLPNMAQRVVPSQEIAINQPSQVIIFQAVMLCILFL